MSENDVFLVSTIVFLVGSALLFVRLYIVRRNHAFDARERQVAKAAEELSQATGELRSVVKIIADSPDPFRELISAMQERKRDNKQSGNFERGRM